MEGEAPWRPTPAVPLEDQGRQTVQDLSGCPMTTATKVALGYVARKDTGFLVKFELYINNDYFLA